MRLQEFYGVPLEGDVGREAYQLVCADSQGELLLNSLNEKFLEISVPDP
jgi:hypothetical protein